VSSSEYLIKFEDHGGISTPVMVAVVFTPDDLTVYLEISQIGVRRVSEHSMEVDVVITINAFFDDLKHGGLDVLTILGAGQISLGGNAGLLSALAGPLRTETP
jgi:hypothetical protein